MDTAYLHLITNHIPIIGVPFALALLALGIWRKSDELKTAGFLIFVFLGLATLGTFLLGQGGEDFVEELAGVSHDAIEDHEDFAKYALASVIIAALFSLLALIRFKGLMFLKRRITDNGKLLNGEVTSATISYYPSWIVFAVLLLALASSAMLGYTGKLGGKIRHSEFYGKAQNSEENDGKNRREKTEQKTETISPVVENQTTQEQNLEPVDEESGKNRRRKRGGKN